MESAEQTTPAVNDIYMRTKSVAAALGVSDTAVASYERQLEERFNITVARKTDGGPAVRLFTIRDLYAITRLRRESRLFKPLARPITIAVYAPKGGVGKSTIASNIISMLQLDGYNVLGVDADHQANLTSMFGYDSELTREDIIADGLPEDRLIQHHFGNLFDIPPFYEPSAGTCVPLAKVIKQPYSEFGPDIIPADTSLSVLENAFGIASNRDHLVDLMLRYARMPENTPQEIAAKREFTIHDARKYDFVIFDCPPQAAHNAVIRPILLACDLLIAPVRMDELSIKGLSLMYAALRQQLKTFGKVPEVMLLPTFYNERLRRVQLAQAKLFQHYGQDLASVKIPQNEEIPSNLIESAPLALSKPTSKVVMQEFRALANEILERSHRIAGKKL